MRKLIIFLSLLFLSSCVSVHVIPLGDAQFYSHNNQVKVYSSKESVKKQYEEIAILTAKTSDGDFVSDESLLKNVLEKVQKIGADAIIFLGHNERGGGGAFIGNAYFQDTHESFRVLAIRFK